jgi:hypothetical protein
MRLICSLLVALSFIPALVAQTDRGTITGAVSDPAGAVIPNATIEARNTVTGAVYRAGSSATGNFTLAEIPAGTYELTVTVSGFKKFVRPGLIVPVAQVIRVDPVLEVGAATETITVQAEAPLLKTESGELSHNIDYNHVDEIPVLTLNGTGTGPGNVRDPLSVVTLLPGAAFSTDNTLRINGMPSSSQAVRVEGQDATNGMWRQQNQVNQQGVDAIQEVSIQTSNYAAEYGQAGGGYFNYTMKSGTNEFHGTAYDYFDNTALNAGTPFTNNGSGGNIRNALHRNDFGGTLGGPVWLPKIYNGHDKTFFFVNFEQFRENQKVATGVATVPTAAYRGGDFSAAPFAIPLPPDPLGRVFNEGTVFDPATTRPASNGQLVRDPYQNGQIPLSQMDPIALKFQSYIPLPNAPGAVNNYNIPAYSNYRHTTIPSVKIDHNLSDTVKISGYFSQTHTTSPNANGFSPLLAPVAPQDDTARTTRLNFDQTITPTLLLHLGAGLLYTNHPAIAPTYDTSQLWAPNQQFAANNLEPSLGGLNNTFTGGLSLGTGFLAPGIGVQTFSDILLKDIKPTANANLTWVHGNHTFKVGGELVVEGFPQQSQSRANGVYTFAAAQTSNPWENGQTGFFTTGFPYASFLIGQSSSLLVSQITDTRLGNHSLGLFVQDNWKITRKLTLDYGLRYDYVTLLREQYGRMQNAAFSTPNPAAGGLPGNVIYEGHSEGRCNCSYNHNYPYAFGPRLGLAYQFAPKTVFRAGIGVSYSSAPNNAFLSYSVADFYTVGAAGYGNAATQLSQGNPYAPGNIFGNAPIHWPDFSPHYPNQVSASGCGPTGVSPCVPPESPFISIDRNAGRLPRILNWSISLQREVVPNLLVEASYVANRGVWWTAPELATYNYNALTPEGLLNTRQYGATTGLNIANPADGALLNNPISNPAVIARFPLLANPNNVYPGFPASQTLGQALRPYPQWNGVPPFLGPPLGDTWYDSLQVKVTKRYSHGLDAQVAFTWQKELDLGVNSDTSYLTPNPAVINDVFNYGLNKQLSGFDRPLVLVINFNYTTPKLGAASTGYRVLSAFARDWTIGGVLRYQSGVLIQSPPSSNNLLTELQRGPANNPALWGGGSTIMNRVPGVPLLNLDPNCHCFDPQQTLALNGAAWTDAAPGQFGSGAPYYDNYRWQRQPQENLSLGRIFRIREKYSFSVRAEFFNIFNRVALTPPSVSAGFVNVNPFTAPQKTNGVYTAGYGFINMNPGTAGINYVEKPRTGQLVARFTF